MSEFKFRYEVQTRFSDIDALGHLNHLAYLDALECGRIAYYFEVMGLTSVQEIKFVLAELRVRYAASALLGQTLVVGVRTDWLKRSSSGFSYQIRDKETGQTLVSGEGVQVYMDLAANQSRPLPEEYRERTRTFEGGELLPP